MGCRSIRALGCRWIIESRGWVVVAWMCAAVRRRDDQRAAGSASRGRAGRWCGRSGADGGGAPASGPPHRASGPAVGGDLPNQRLDGAAPGTRFEREIVGIERATYFFLGCGAYPHGSVALLLDGVPSEPRSTATPFDSGGCEANHCTTRWSITWRQSHELELARCVRGRLHERAVGECAVWARGGRARARRAPGCSPDPRASRERRPRLG